MAFFLTLLLGEMENGSKNRVHRVDILKIAEPCPLIDPSQVVVTQGEILVADPVLTPIGKNSCMMMSWPHLQYSKEARVKTEFF